MAKAKPKASSNKVVEKSQLDNIKERLSAKDSVAKRAKELAAVPTAHAGLFTHLEESGTGKSKLDFLLSLDFGKETNQKKIAELACAAFDDAGYSDATLTKILKYAESAGSK